MRADTARMMTAAAQEKLAEQRQAEADAQELYLQRIKNVARVESARIHQWVVDKIITAANAGSSTTIVNTGEHVNQMTKYVMHYVSTALESDGYTCVVTSRDIASHNPATCETQEYILEIKW